MCLAMLNTNASILGLFKAVYPLFALHLVHFERCDTLVEIDRACGTAYRTRHPRTSTFRPLDRAASAVAETLGPRRTAALGWSDERRDNQHLTLLSSHSLGGAYAVIAMHVCVN